MGRQAAGTRAASRERLSRDALVDGALAVADAEGLDAVTIRRLAQDHGVTPMALYWHFRDKDLLLDAMAERVLSTVALPPTAPSHPASAWHERFRDLLTAIVVSLRAHPAVVPLLPTRMMSSGPGLAVTERALELLDEAGFGPEQSAQLAAQALTSIVQLVTGEPGLTVGADAAERDRRMRTKRAALQSLQPDSYPRIRASAEGFLACGSGQAWFELGLDVFVAGLRAVQPGRSASAGAR